jgi:OOP family OmpA-OmpF porin
MAIIKRLLLSMILLLTLALSLSIAQDNSSNAPAKSASFELEGNMLKIPGPVVFKTDSDQLAPESSVVLEHVRNYLQAKSYISLMRIEGHLDGAGNSAALQTLSEKRAMAVARWLVAHGIDCQRLLPVGFGSNKPIADNRTPEGKAQNRRISFVNAALRGRAIGGFPLDGGGKVAGDPCKP